MKKITSILICVILILSLFSGCQKTAYTIADGVYVFDDSTIEISSPNLIINGQRMTLVQYIAVSYQPSGDYTRDGNIITLETDYAGEHYKWVFRLVADNTLKLLYDKCVIPDNHAGWNDGMTFTCIAEITQEGNENTDSKQNSAFAGP